MGEGADGPGDRFVNSRTAVLVKPDGVLVPLPLSQSNAYTAPAGSLLMTSGGSTITLPPGIYTGPYGVITVTPKTAADIPATEPAHITEPKEQAVEVFDVNANLVGFIVSNPATGTTQLISPAGSIMGSVRAEQATGNVFVLGVSADVLGGLGINPVNNAVTLVPVAAPPATAATTQAADAQTASGLTSGTPGDLAAPLHDANGNVVGEVDINLSTGKVTLVRMVTAATPAAVGTQASAVTDAPVEVFDLNGDPVGFAVGDPATDAVHLVSPGRAIIGSIRADPNTGTLVVAVDAAHGQLGIDPTTGKVILVPSGAGG